MGAMRALVFPNRVLFTALLDNEVVSPSLASHPLKDSVAGGVWTTLLDLGFHFSCLRLGTHNLPTPPTFECPKAEAILSLVRQRMEAPCMFYVPAGAPCPVGVGPTGRLAVSNVPTYLWALRPSREVEATLRASLGRGRILQARVFDGLQAKERGNPTQHSVK
jgi:hypothetical protein